MRRLARTGQARSVSAWLVLEGKLREKNGNHWIWDFKVSFKDYLSEDNLVPHLLPPLQLLVWTDLLIQRTQDSHRTTG